ncbi:hypothetical protein Rcae01_04862 [Novipirellula caenicola]|uniref:Uncharacterized protein n=2 Tax=Novipirellula caenicola TaxID=1536901 RepID=A0ABP9W0H1_9BACT
MAIRIECPCGHVMSDFLDNRPFKAEILPDQSTDDFCGAIENAVAAHDNTGTAQQYAIYDTVPFFRDIWHCPECGRLTVEAADGNYYHFSPDNPDTPPVLSKSNPA